MLNCSVKAADVQSMPGVFMIVMSDCGSEVGCWFTCGFSKKNCDILFLDK